MTIADLLKHKEKRLFTTTPQTTITEVINTLNSNQIGSLIVLDSTNKVEGIITERDILRKLPNDLNGLTVKDLMTHKEKLLIIHTDDTLDYTMGIFTTHKIRHLPVFDEEKLVGLISIGDTIKATLQQSEYENKLLNDYIYSPFG